MGLSHSLGPVDDDGSVAGRHLKNRDNPLSTVTDQMGHVPSAKRANNVPVRKNCQLARPRVTPAHLQTAPLQASWHSFGCFFSFCKNLGPVRNTSDFEGLDPCSGGPGRDSEGRAVLSCVSHGEASIFTPFRHTMGGTPPPGKKGGGRKRCEPRPLF